MRLLSTRTTTNEVAKHMNKGILGRCTGKTTNEVAEHKNKGI